MNEPIVLLFASSFIASVLLGAVLTYGVRNFARARRWVSIPEYRDLHTEPVPRIGGVAVFLAFALLMAISWFVGLDVRPILTVAIPGTLLFLVGLVDDFISLRPITKLFFQIIAALALFSSGSSVLEFAISGWPLLSWGISGLATVLWVLTITNAFNLIDGLDGLAAGSALFSIVTLLGLATVEGNQSVILATLVLAGAILGFLRYNFNPASIFLGDSGSLFVGFMLSGLALQAQRATLPTLVAVAIPLVAFSLPVVETTVSVLRRFLGGQPVFHADQDHIHHRLLQMGLSHRQVVIALYGVSAGCALISLFLLYPGRSWVGLVLLVVGMIFCFGVQRLGYPEFTEIGRIAQRTWEQKKVIANNIAIRRAAAALREVNTERELKRILDLLFGDTEFDGYALVLDNGVNKPIVCEWNESEYAPAGGWTMILDLQTADAGPMGRLTIHRRDRGSNLLVDINVLVDELQPALTQACERILGSKLQPLPIALVRPSADLADLAVDN